MQELFVIVVVAILFLCVAAFFAFAFAKFDGDSLSFEDSWGGETEDYEEYTITDLADDLQAEIYLEGQNARLKFGPFHSSHEGFAVLHEEFDELKDEVWSNETKNPERNQRMREEAIQVAAMALRFLTDVCHKENV